jgi:hypothetical protein
MISTYCTMAESRIGDFIDVLFVYLNVHVIEAVILPVGPDVRRQ